MTARDDLAQLIADATSYRDPSGETVFKFAEQRIAGSDVYLNQMPDAIADAILARFLVVPLSDIQGTEYGWRHPMADVDGPCEHGALSERDARRLAGKWGEAIQRPILPWTPIPEGGEPR